MFYTFAQADQLVHDFTTNCLYNLYHDGRSSIDKSDVFQWFDSKVAEGHSEIAAWSPQTRSKLASNLLSIARDFGILEGTQRKIFRRLYVPLPAFLYVLYDLHDKGLSGRQLIEAKAFRLFLLDHDDILLLVGEAARKGYATFRQTGNIFDLRLHYENLVEAMDHAIAAQVP